jgi:hypothetical protein
MNIHKHTAILSLYDNVEWINEGEAFDNDGNALTLDEGLITQEVIRLQELYDSQEYARNRKAEYDQLNQFELMTDDAINGTTSHLDAIESIKAKYPKPE